jgi:hypothetical protein
MWEQPSPCGLAAPHRRPCPPWPPNRHINRELIMGLAGGKLPARSGLGWADIASYQLTMAFFLAPGTVEVESRQRPVRVSSRGGGACRRTMRGRMAVRGFGDISSGGNDGAPTRGLGSQRFGFAQDDRLRRVRRSRFSPVTRRDRQFDLSPSGPRVPEGCGQGARRWHAAEPTVSCRTLTAGRGALPPN